MNMEANLKRLVEFWFEVGMLKKTPRSGYQFLGTGKENVAEHCFRTAIIGFTLGRLAKVDAYKVALLCLFHDLAEARCGDFNYVNKIYNTANEKQAIEDALYGTGLEEEIKEFIEELERGLTLEAALAHDADQLDLILNLKEQLDLGNKYAQKWIDCAIKRLQTEQGKELAKYIQETDHTNWWFRCQDTSWWEKKHISKKHDF
ncbi:MAG: HD domain-containing protein [Desulfonauticus sp.]|nr:HD domain-containing protein [Desulfonauticus sp.]